MVLTMAAVADHKGIACRGLAASVEGQTRFEGRRTVTHFTSRLGLGEDLTPREKRILYNSARRCEVHKMLGGEITFEEHLVDPEV